MSNNHTERLEVFAFSSCIAVAAAYAAYLLFTFIPDEQLVGAGIEYFPAKEWFITVPGFLLFTVLCVFAGYGGLTLARTPSIDSPCTVTDSHAVFANSCYDDSSDTPAFCDVPLRMSTRALLRAVLHDEVAS